MLFSVMGICSHSLTSCSSDDDGGGPKKTALENEFSYNNETTPIGSVVYTKDDASGIYTFYISPTEGLIDLDAMLLADDYILIATNTPTGDIDLTGKDNSLVYKNVKISSETAANVQNSALSLLLTSQTTVKLSLDAAMTSGETLKAEYNGLCIFHKSETEQGDALKMDKPMFGYWRGQTTSGTNNYLLGVANVDFATMGTNIALKEPGYAMILDCYLDSGDEWKTYPSGTFTESNKFGDHTYFDTNSFVVYFDGSAYTTMHVSSDVTISREGNTTKISTTFIDNEGVDHAVTFEGDLRIGNGTKLPKLTQLMEDVEHKAAYAEGTYMGDLFGTGGGLTLITIDDENRENRVTPYYQVSLGIFCTKWADPKKEMRLEPGTYEVSTTYKKGTWMSPNELEIMGMVLPIGTYVFYDDGVSDSGLYGYCTDGTITIAEADAGKYKIDYDLETVTGYKVTGSYEGSVTLTDSSDDKEDDGSSTLTEDLELDLSYLTAANEPARCFPQTQIYIGGLGYRDINDITSFVPPAPEPCGYQFIELGMATGTYIPDPDYNDPGKLVEGDIIRLDLLVNPGDNDKITPGTYNISPNRYPAQMWPGVCLRGFQATEHIGTRWLFIGNAIGNGYPEYMKDPIFVTDGPLNVPSMKGYASLYTGTVTIEKADGGDNYFTFIIDGEDVLHHSITGTWTGPVVLGTSDTPVVSSGKEFGSTRAEKTSTVSQQTKNRIPTASELKGLQPLPMEPFGQVKFQ